MAQQIEAETSGDTATEAICRMLERARGGDQSVLPELREFLDRRPDLTQKAGDLAFHAREALLGLAAGPCLIARESISRQLAELEAEVGGPSPSPLERLLVERIVICWLQVHLADLDAVAQDRGASPHAAHALRRAESAQRRFLASIRALAVVRRLLRPALSPVQLAMKAVQEAAPPRAGRAPHRDGIPVLN